LAEIFNELDVDDAIYIFKILDSEKTAEILLELEEDVREKYFKVFLQKKLPKK
jgi:magnesium transporter